MEHRDPQLSQAYGDATHPEPSPALDARILDAARQAVAKPAVRPRPFWFAWAVPFSSVAVLVLGVTLLLDMQQRAPEVLEPPSAMPPAIRLDTREAQPEPTKQAAPAERPAKPNEPSRPSKSAESALPLAGRDHLLPDVLPPPDAPDSVSADRGALVMPAPPPQPFPAQSMAGPSRVPAETVVRPAPAGAPEAARATGNDAGPSADAMRSSPSTSARSAERAGASASGISTEMHKAAQPVAEGPERLVETIRRLIREGRLDQARVTLEKLRQAYPGFAVPEELKDAVASPQ